MPVGPWPYDDVVMCAPPVLMGVVVEGEVGFKLLILLEVTFILWRGEANAEPNSRAATERYEVYMIRYLLVEKR